MREWLGKLTDSSQLLMKGEKWGGIRGFGRIPQVWTFLVRDVSKTLVSLGIEAGHLMTKLPSPTQLLESVTIAELKALVGENDRTVRDLTPEPLLQVVKLGRVLSPCVSPQVRSSVGVWQVLHEVIVNVRKVGGEHVEEATCDLLIRLWAVAKGLTYTVKTFRIGEDDPSLDQVFAAALGRVRSVLQAN